MGWFGKNSEIRTNFHTRRTLFHSKFDQLTRSLYRWVCWREFQFFFQCNSHFNHRIASELLTVRCNPNITNWNIEDGYQSDVNESEAYPYRVFDSSMHNAMTLVLSITVDNSFRLCTFGVGFIIALHMPDEKVDIYKNSIYMPSEQHGSISIKPRVTVTSEGLRSYSPQVRGCYFRSERQLRFFKSYSLQKCEIECLANFTRNKCGCVRFDMPSISMLIFFLKIG